MSFDIFFQPGRFVGPPVVGENPITGEVRMVLPEEPLSPDEVQAVRQVIERAVAGGPDEFGCYVVGFPDGGEAEVYADRLETSCMVATRGVTPDLIHFLFDLLRAGNWAMVPAMEDTVTVTTAPARLKNLPDDYPRVVTCDSADDLRVLLAGGLRAWQNYRDQVADGG